MSCPSCCHPVRFRPTVIFAHRTCYRPILTKFDPGAGLAPKMRPDRLTVAWDKCIEIDKVRNALRDVLQRAGDDKATIREANENDLVEILVQYVIDDVADVRTEADQRAGKMNPFANA